MDGHKFSCLSVYDGYGHVLDNYSSPQHGTYNSTRGHMFHIEEMAHEEKKKKKRLRTAFLQGPDLHITVVTHRTHILF